MKTFFEKVIYVMFVYISILSVSFGQENAENLFIWNEANARFATANTSQDYIEVAKKYQQLINSGIKSWQLYFNFGTALLYAGLYDEAIKSLELAEQICGKNSDIEINLIAAYSRKEGVVVSLPWYRKLFFWHFNYNIKTRIEIAIISFCALWLGLILRRIKLYTLSKYLLVISLIVLLLFVSSLFASFHQFNTFNPILPDISQSSSA